MASRTRLARLSLLLGALVFVILALRWGIPFFTTERDVAASTPGPPPFSVEVPIVLKPGSSACAAPVTVDERAETLRLRLKQRPLRSGLEASFSAPGYRAEALIPPQPARDFNIHSRVRPPRGSTIGELCVRNIGREPVSLVGTDEPRSRSRPELEVDGRPNVNDLNIAFYEREQNSLASRLPTVLEHAGAFVPGTRPRMARVGARGPGRASGTGGLPLCALPRHACRRRGRAGRLVNAARLHALVVRPRVIVALAFAVTAGYLSYQGARIEDYTLLVDELLYTEMARAFAAGELLSPDLYASGGIPSQLYPRLLAPLYAVFDSTGAFTAAHVLNALFFASTLFPVYLIGRRIGLGWPLALLAGLLSVWVPWAASVSFVMTEALTYPLFALSLLAVLAAVQAGSARVDLLAFVAIAALAYARAQFVFMFVVLALAVVLHAFGMAGAERRAGAGNAVAGMRARLRPHLVPAVVLGCAIVLVFALGALGVDLLQNYSLTTSKQPFPPGLLDVAVRDLARIVVGVAIVPAICWVAWTARTLAWPANGAQHALAVAGALAGAGVLYQAAFVQQNIAGGVIQERYVFYIVPLFALALVALLSDERRPRPGLSLVGGGLLVLAVVVTDPYLPQSHSASQILIAAGSNLHSALNNGLGDLSGFLLGSPLRTVESLAILTVGATAALLVLVRLRRQGLVALAAAGALLVVGIVQTHHVVRQTVPLANANWRFIPGLQQTERDWIDAAVPDGAEVGIVPGPIGGNPYLGDSWLWVEFWTDSAKATYSFEGRNTYHGFAYLPLERERGSDRLRTPKQLRYLAVSADDPDLRLRGRVIARSPLGIELIEPQRPYRAVPPGTSTTVRRLGLPNTR